MASLDLVEDRLDMGKDMIDSKRLKDRQVELVVVGPQDMCTREEKEEQEKKQGETNIEDNRGEEEEANSYR